MGHRRALKHRAKTVKTPWYRSKLEALAKDLWTHRYTVLKADERLSPEERRDLLALMDADPKAARLRTFLTGVWQLFEHSQNPAQARL